MQAQAAGCVGVWHARPRRTWAAQGPWASQPPQRVLLGGAAAHRGLQALQVTGGSTGCVPRCAGAADARCGARSRACRRCVGSIGPIDCWKRVSEYPKCVQVAPLHWRRQAAACKGAAGSTGPHSIRPSRPLAACLPPPATMQQQMAFTSSVRGTALPCKPRPSHGTRSAPLRWPSRLHNNCERFRAPAPPAVAARARLAVRGQSQQAPRSVQTSRWGGSGTGMLAAAPQTLVQPLAVPATACRPRRKAVGTHAARPADLCCQCCPLAGSRWHRCQFASSSRIQALPARARPLSKQRPPLLTVYRPPAGSSSSRSTATAEAVTNGIVTSPLFRLSYDTDNVRGRPAAAGQGWDARQAAPCARCLPACWPQAHNPTLPRGPAGSGCMPLHLPCMPLAFAKTAHTAWRLLQLCAGLLLAPRSPPAGRHPSPCSECTSPRRRSTRT